MGYWYDWHIEKHSDPNSYTSQRMTDIGLVIEEYLKDTVHRSNIVSVCAGQGLDLIPILRQYPNSADAYLIDIEQQNIDHINKISTGLEGIHTYAADATVSNTYINNKIPRANLLLVCGVFAHLTSEDQSIFIQNMRSLLKPGGYVIWTRIDEYLNDIHEKFENNGYKKIDLSHINLSTGSVGMSRLKESIKTLHPDKQIFNFLDLRE
jgi:2-polyprenyl-3-methyl-5-hydroxy-6-metoxy-1,4-benzoquinol methylase